MIRKASAAWNGGLTDGNGTISTNSGVLRDTPYSFSTRFENGAGTNPEELIGAAHAACYSMALAAGLGGAGFSPESVQTSARVTIEKKEAGFRITLIELDCEARVPGIDEKSFQEHAEATKTGCPVSQALAATEVKLSAKLA